MLNHKAIHHFIEEIQKPEIYRLKDAEKLYREYFSPKLLSFTYIARNIKDALNAERKQKGLDQIYFKLASQNPRNKINIADAKELQLLQAFNAGTLQEYKTTVNTKNEKALYYAIPIAPNKQSCMHCHDDPAVAPKEMVKKYGDQAGFHEKIGEIRALISVRVPMAGLVADSNKTAFFLSSATFLLLSGAFVVVFFFFHKIEVQKELAVENSYYLNSILQSSTDTAILASDLNYNIKYFNKTAEQLFDVPAAIALKSNIKEFYNRIDQKSTENFLYAINRVRKQGSFRFRLKHDRKTLDANVSTIVNNEGECAGFLLLSHDISGRLAEEKAREETKERLQKAEKMESIGLMAAGVAHDLNNILSGIVSYPELLLLQLPEDSDLRGPIKDIQESGKRAATVVADLLTVARGAASTREVHSLNDLIEDYFSSPEFKNLQSSSFFNITYQHQFEATQPLILCSPVHVKKCLMNLVTNAVEAIVDKGSVIVSTYNQTIDNSASTEHDIQNGQYVVLSVQDTGPGISDKDAEHIFEPFYSRKVMGRSGTGLGLAVVWNTMDDHGGKVLVESSDKGTCFLLYFPVSKLEKVAQVKNDRTAELTGNGENILVVDDEPQLRDIASQMLQAIGYTVHSVCSGELAIQFVKENPVDLIVIDMLMEPGMNGRQTYAEMLKLYPDQKAIIASGFSESDDVKATLKLGAGGFIKKPYSMDQLGRAVNEVLNS